MTEVENGLTILHSSTEHRWEEREFVDAEGNEQMRLFQVPYQLQLRLAPDETESGEAFYRIAGTIDGEPIECELLTPEELHHVVLDVESRSVKAVSAVREGHVHILTREAR